MVTDISPAGGKRMRLSEVSRSALIMMAAAIVLLLPAGSYANPVFTYDFTGGGFGAGFMAQMNTALAIADHELSALFSNNAHINIQYQRRPRRGWPTAISTLATSPLHTMEGGWTMPRPRQSRQLIRCCIRKTPPSRAP